MGRERQAAFDEKFPRLRVNVPENGALHPKTLFQDLPEPLWMEIGFGNGEHVLGLLEQNPVLAVEPFQNGMATLLKHLPPEHEERLRVFMDDGMILARALSPESLQGIYILNPDPWPKKRHYKRRLIQQESLKEFHRILCPSGQLILSTDVDDLAEWMLTQTLQSGLFEWRATRALDWQTQPEGWISTRYETKGIKAGRRQTYLLFSKKT